MAFFAKYKIRTQDKEGNKLRFWADNEVKNVDPTLMKELKENGHVYEEKSETQSQAQSKSE